MSTTGTQFRRLQGDYRNPVSAFSFHKQYQLWSSVFQAKSAAPLDIGGGGGLEEICEKDILFPQRYIKTSLSDIGKKYIVFLWWKKKMFRK